MNPPDQPPKSHVLEPSLAESINRFFEQHRNGVTDFSDFISIFSRLLQSFPDPPLELLWLHSALTFQSEQFHVGDGVAAVKHLFQLLVSSSTSCYGSKRIALLAPVIYKLYHMDLHRADLMGDVECLLEGITCFMSICCLPVAEDSDGLIHHFCDLSRVWMLANTGCESQVGDDLGAFIPLISHEIRLKIRAECSVGYLAGVVMCEAVLLRLCMKFGFGIPRVSLEKELRDCAAQMVIGFRSLYFLDTLLRMLLGPVLPVTSVLGPANEALLREVLTDAVIRVEHSYLNPGNGILVSIEQSKILAVAYLLVTESAIRLAREKSDEQKVTSYMMALSRSCLPTLLVKWINDQTDVEMPGSRDIFNPIALIKCLLIIEGQGVKVFECDVSKHHARAVLCRSRVEREVSDFQLNCENLGTFSAYTNWEARTYGKVSDDLEMLDSSPTLPLHASCLMESGVTTCFRKRKECNILEGHTALKLVKHRFRENPIREKLMDLGNEDCCRGTVIDYHGVDEFMEDLRP